LLKFKVKRPTTAVLTMNPVDEAHPAVFPANQGTGRIGIILYDKRPLIGEDVQASSAAQKKEN
jgi:hypothetical protein